MDKHTEIQECKREINELQHRINILANKVNQLSIEEEKNVVGKMQPLVQETASVPPQITQPIRNTQPPMQNSQPPVKPPKQKVMPKTKTEGVRYSNPNMERNIGKNLFAIIASILILIGVGIFISTIYEYIPEFIKIIAIYLFGFAMTSVGVGAYLKNKNNFWLGLASCGTAELLVSIITSYTYFEVISLPITFILILLWVVGTFVLTKVKPALFKTIGYIGFIVSIMLGLSLLELHEGEMFIFLFISYVVVNIFFVLTHKNLPVLNLVLMYVGMFLLVLFSDENYYIGAPYISTSGIEFAQANTISLHFYCVIMIAVFNLIHLLKYKKYNVSYSIFSGISFVVILCYLNHLNVETLYPVMTIIMTGLWVLNIVKCGANGKNLLYEFISIPTFLLMTLLSLFADNTVFLMIVILPVVTFTLVYMKTHDYVSGFMGLLIFLFLFAIDIPELLLYAICFIFSCVLFMLTREEQKWGLIVKNGWYLWMLCSIMILLDALTSELTYNAAHYTVSNIISDNMLVLTFAIISIINLCRIIKSAYVKNIGFKHDTESIFLYVVNGVLICSALNILGPNDMSGLPTFAMILITLVLLSITLMQPLNTDWKRQYLTLIQCIKFTFYFWFLMMTFEAEMIFINIAMLTFAIAAIIVGFKLRSKPARIYGLVLSLVSSVSLVLFSVSFDSTLQVAGGIILCGLLCFVISFIYSKASKALDTTDK